MRWRVPSVAPHLVPEPLLPTDVRLEDLASFGAASSGTVQLGTPKAGRIIVVVAYIVNSSVATAEIDDCPLYLVVGADSGAARPRIFMGLVPDGTSGTLAFDTAGLATRVAVYSAESIDSALQVVETASTDSITGVAGQLDLSVALAAAGNLVTIGATQNGIQSIVYDVQSVDDADDALSNEWYIAAHSRQVSGTQDIAYAPFGVTSTAAIAAGFELSGLADLASPELWYLGEFDLGSGSSRTVAIGDADADRKIFVVVSNADSSDATVSSVTIGGVSASLVVSELFSSSADVSTSLWVADVPTGTSAAVVLSSGFTGSNIRVYRAIATESASAIAAGAVTDTSTGVAAPSLSVTAPSGSAVITSATVLNGSATSGITGVDAFDANHDYNSGEYAAGGHSDNKSGLQTITYGTFGTASVAAFAAAFTLTAPSGVLTIAPAGIASAEAFGTPSVAPGAVTVSPSGIASAEAFGTPAVTTGAQIIAPAGIPSGEAFGAATVTPGAVSLAPAGIVSAEAFGVPSVSIGAATIQPTGIASAEAFGAPVLSVGAVPVGPTGIPSSEAFGTPTIDAGAVSVAPAGIPSAEAFGAPSIASGAVSIAPAGIASGEAFGTPSITGGTQRLSMSSIAAAIYETLRDSSDLLAVTGSKDGAPSYARVWNNVPQTTARPYVKYRLSPGARWDTKATDSSGDGYDSIVTIDAWSDRHDDLEVLDMLDACHAALHNADLGAITGGGIACLRYLDATVLTEGDESHHGVARYGILAYSGS